MTHISSGDNMCFTESLLGLLACFIVLICDCKLQVEDWSDHIFLLAPKVCPRAEYTSI